MATEEESQDLPQDELIPGSAESLEQLAKELELPFLKTLLEIEPPTELRRGDFDRLFGAWGRARLTIPIGFEDGSQQSLLVATAAPLDREARQVLEWCYAMPATVVVTSAEEIYRAINHVRSRLMSDRSQSLSAGEKDDDDSVSDQLKIDVTDSDDDAPIMRYVNAIVFKANSMRASDIHIEPYEESVNVRFRIDGVLYDIDHQDKSHHPAISSRLKVMAGLNIAEKRLPQDGRIGLKIAGKDVDIRMSTIPTQFGERIVLRILDKTETILDLATIGIRDRNLKVFARMITKPNGIVLLTGPTGSGKTTTLYSALTKINTPELNILTVEDPIEYQLRGIGQMQVNPKIQFTFANGLRAILRQDPDVVMVGEIRDTETAEIAIQASLTGHLVLSTVHTNDAPGAVTRLLDMGIEPFLVSSSLLAVMAQRLVRRLCVECKEPYEISEAELRELGLPAGAGKQAFKPGTRECSECQNNRYRGRTGIHELLIIDDDIRSLILSRTDSTTIRNLALQRGFETLRMDGGYKVLEGVTSVEEVLLVTHEDSLLNEDPLERVSGAASTQSS